MAVARDRFDESVLARLVPMSRLGPAHRGELLEHAAVLEFAAGDVVDTLAGSPARTCYLASGTIELLEGGKVVHRLNASDDRARFPLAQSGLDHDDARAVTAVELLQVERARISTLLILAEVTPPGSASDGRSEEAWSAKLLGSELFTRIPAANVQLIFGKMKPVDFARGDVVVRQGDIGQHYYIIRAGRCAVSHRPGPGLEPLKLADLGPGDSFGEEALVSGARRNATVSMLANGTLMRLTKEDFVELIRDPILDAVDVHEARRRLQDGACLLDVRLSEEHQTSGLPGSIRVGLAEVRAQSHTLDPNKSYIVYCNSGRRSAAAAFLLAERGYRAAVLVGGLTALASEQRAAALARAQGAPPETSAVPVPVKDDDTSFKHLEEQLLLADAAFEAALRQKTEAEIARQVAGREIEAQSAQARSRVAERLRELEGASQAASQTLEETQRNKLALETKLRHAEATAAAQRRHAEAAIERLRREAEKRLREEEERLKAEYTQAADEMQRLQAAEREAERRFAEEQARLERELEATREKMAAEMQRIRAQIDAMKRDAQTKVSSIRSDERTREEHLREETEQRLRTERRRLEAEFALSVTAQEKAQHELKAALAAQSSAHSEAERIGRELAGADARRRTETQAREARERERGEALGAEAVRRLEAARAHAIKSGANVQPAELDLASTMVRHAGEALEEAMREKKRIDLEREHIEEKQVRRAAVEEELRLKASQTAQRWLDEEQERSERELERLTTLEQGFVRLRSEKVSRQRQEVESDEGLLDDIMTQLADPDRTASKPGLDEERSAGQRELAERQAELTRNARRETAAEQQRAAEALARARAQVEALRNRVRQDEED